MRQGRFDYSALLLLNKFRRDFVQLALPPLPAPPSRLAPRSRCAAANRPAESDRPRTKRRRVRSHSPARAHCPDNLVTTKYRRLRIDFLWFNPSRTRLFLQEMVHEQRHILQALPQRRNLHRNDRQPIIRSSRNVPSLSFVVMARSSRPPRAHSLARSCYHRPAAPRRSCRNAQQLCLQRRGHRVYLIEKNRAEIRLFEQATFIGHCAA